MNAQASTEDPWGLSAAQRLAMAAMVEIGNSKRAAQHLGKSQGAVNRAVERARKQMGMEHQLQAIVAYAQWLTARAAGLAEYLKEGESIRECLQRNQADHVAALGLVVKEQERGKAMARLAIAEAWRAAIDTAKDGNPPAEVPDHTVEVILMNARAEATQ